MDFDLHAASRPRRSRRSRPCSWPRSRRSSGWCCRLPVAWLGAANITPLGKHVYVVGRFLMTMSRSVHEIVWGLIFVSAVGLGALAGVLAMAVRSVGFISKMIAEAIEDVRSEADRGDARGRRQQAPDPDLRASCRRSSRCCWATMIFEWDINIRRSTIMGLVGAGGLGLVLFRQMAMSNYGGIATVILAILLPHRLRRSRLALCTQSRHLSARGWSGAQRRRRTGRARSSQACSAASAFRRASTIRRAARRRWRSSRGRSTTSNIDLDRLPGHARTDGRDARAALFPAQPRARRCSSSTCTRSSRRCRCRTSRP